MHCDILLLYIGVKDLYLLILFEKKKHHNFET